MKTKLAKAISALTLAFTLITAPAAKADVREGVLYEGEVETYTVFLERGEWFEARAITDSDGLDIDLIAYGPGGWVADEDTLSDDVPQIGFFAPRSGTYRITVSMPDTYRGRPAAYRLVTE